MGTPGDDGILAARADNRDAAVFAYLDDLRESGSTNMYGAAPYVAEVFGVSKPDARKLLTKWMETFGERHVSPTRTNHGGDTVTLN